MSFLSSAVGEPEKPGSAAAGRYRLLLWTYAVVCLGSLAAWAMMQRGTLDPGLKPFAVLGTVLAGLGAFVSFRQGTLAAKEERAREERKTMLLILAAELGKQDDAALDRISRQRGMAGEAAAWILAERLRKRSGAPSPEREARQPPAG